MRANDKGRLETPVLDPTDPGSGCLTTAYFSLRELTEMAETDRMSFWQVKVAAECLRAPLRILEGIRNGHHDEPWGWCYVSRPEFISLTETDKLALPGGMLFAVYLNPDLAAFAWRLEPAEPNDPLQPKAVNPAQPDVRFRRVVWTKK